jgi:hypothetical protein
VHGLFFPEHERITFFPQKVTRKKKVFFFTDYTTLRMHVFLRQPKLKDT